MTPTLEQIIRRAIEQDGRPADKLAAASGVDQGIISRFIRGDRTMTLPTADKLCRVLGLELRPRQRKAVK
jgi:ribosome-binding protein aMBF1 (putative translation factor)